MSSISFSGLASGLDTTSLINNLLRFDQQRIDKLNQSVQASTTKQTAFQGIQTRLQTLETQAAKLARAQGGIFDAKTVTSSDTGLVVATAGSGAQTGVTNLRVLSLAQAGQIASQGFDDVNSLISQGTFQVQAGGKTAILTIDSSNNTLSGLAKAINNAGIGVSASVINDGSDSRTQPYRLLLTSKTTGTDNAIQITNNLAPDGNGAVRPDFNSTQTSSAVTATNYSGTASVTSNSGAGTYTGTTNDTFTFTVLSGGTVGTDDGIQIAYSDSSGSRTGTIVLNQADAGVLQDVADGVQVQLGSGTLNVGDKFSIDVFAPTIQAAANSQVQLGSGAGAIVVQNSSNTLTNLIPGVTLNLQAADPTKQIQLTVANDVAGAATEITNFVKDYNDFASFLTTQTKFDRTTNKAGPLNGNRTVSTLRDQVQQTLLAVSSNLPSQANRLGVLGIAPDSNGQLTIDTAKLNSVLSGNVPGIGFSDLKKLFDLQGESSSAGIEFATGSSKTRESTTPYQVHITQAAERASLTSANSLATSTVIDDTNDTVVVQVNGTTDSSITLAHGTYTQLDLARQVQSAINAVVLSNGSAVTVSLANQNLVIASNRYGSASTVSVVSGSALAALGFAGGESDAGQDVAGSYLVGGVTETATGVGQILTGNSANVNTADLTIVVSLTPTQVLSGGDIDLTVTRGLAAKLDDILQNLLDPATGRVKVINDEFTTDIQNAKDTVANETAAMNDQRAALLRQFAQMESAMANLQSQSNLLTSALSAAITATSTPKSKSA